MFSVDNFYEFFNSCYGSKSKNIVPWIFRPHGSKNLAESFPLIEKHPHASMELAELQISNALIMHDQESFFHDHCMHIYRTDLLCNKKNPAWQEMTNEELFLQKWRTCSWPIFCHSEKNSKDIAWVEQTGCIPCYYFWHGLIARDWFRHWKHYNNLQNQSTWQKRFLLYIRDCSGTRSYRSDIKNRLYELKDQIDTDWDRTRNLSSDFSAKISMEDGQNTAIHLVAETLFDESKIHVTEKVFKPMVMEQPFILFSAPHTLEYLRNYGFRTFDHIWDESYDQEKNPSVRMDKIINLIKKLCNKSNTEFQDIIFHCREIIDHNKKYFFSDRFEEILLNELHYNMQIAIQEQQNRSVIDPGGSIFFVYDNIIKKNISISPHLKEDMRNIIAVMSTQYPKRYQLIKQKYPWC